MLHIVHLEDETPLSEILQATIELADPDAQIKHFINSDDAMQYIEEYGQAVDLFVLDIRVPGKLDGLEIAYEIRALGCPGEIVITSAYQFPSFDVLNELQAEWIPKPWHVKELSTRLVEIANRQQ